VNKQMSIFDYICPNEDIEFLYRCIPENYENIICGIVVYRGDYKLVLKKGRAKIFKDGKLIESL